MMFQCWRRSIFNEWQPYVLIGSRAPPQTFGPPTITSMRPSLIPTSPFPCICNSTVETRSVSGAANFRGQQWAPHGGGSAHSSQLEIFAISQVFTPVAGDGRYDRAISLRGNAMFLPVWTGGGATRWSFSNLFEAHILATFCLNIFHCTIWTAKRFNAMHWSIITDNLTQ